MKQEKIYHIEYWTDWNHKIAASIDDFFVTYTNYPNILEANEHTFSQFDFLVNEMEGEKQHVKKVNDLLQNEPHPSSVLQALPSNISAKEIIRIEKLYKKKLGTRAFGLNSN